MARIWPLLFLTFFSFLRKYLRKNKQDLSSEIRTEKAVENPGTRGYGTDQNLDLARTSLVAQSFIR